MTHKDQVPIYANPVLQEQLRAGIPGANAAPTIGNASPVAALTPQEEHAATMARLGRLPDGTLPRPAQPFDGARDSTGRPCGPALSQSEIGQRALLDAVANSAKRKRE